MNELNNIKDILFSLINYGINSNEKNKFIEICKQFAEKTFKKNYFKNEILNKEGSSTKYLAYDLIADLFEVREYKYFYIENFFKNILNNYDKTTNDEIIAKLVTLVRSRVHQRINEIREDYGELYFKIKKAVDIFFCRNTEGYNEIIFRDVIYFYNCPQDIIDFDLNQYPQDELTSEIFYYKINNYQIPELIRTSFIILNNQEDFCKAIKKDNLITAITNLFKERLKDYVSKNVDYIYYEKDNE